MGWVKGMKHSEQAKANMRKPRVTYMGLTKEQREEQTRFRKQAKTELGKLLTQAFREPDKRIEINMDLPHE